MNQPLVKKSFREQKLERQLNCEGFNGINLRIFACPQCSKRRLTRPLDHIVSLEKQDYTTNKNDTISLFKDICDYCKQRNFDKYFVPLKANLQKVLTNKPLDEHQSLEDIL